MSTQVSGLVDSPSNPASCGARLGAGSAVSLSVSIGDQDRRLERLLDDVSAARVDLEDMAFPDAAAPHGSVELLVAADAARPLADALRERGWAVR